MFGDQTVAHHCALGLQVISIAFRKAFRKIQLFSCAEETFFVTETSNSKSVQDPPRNLQSWQSPLAPWPHQPSQCRQGPHAVCLVLKTCKAHQAVQCLDTSPDMRSHQSSCVCPPNLILADEIPDLPGEQGWTSTDHTGQSVSFCDAYGGLVRAHHRPSPHSDTLIQ